MPSHMFGQTFATERNAKAELLSSFLIRSFSQALYNRGFVTNVVEADSQVEFVRDDCSDIFDHYAQFQFTANSALKRTQLELWGQTTCYKGNTLGVAEANKTYELRESLIEALGLRRALRAERMSFRTLHITWGHSSYCYGWTKVAKESSFDISLYLDDSISADDLFDDLDKVLAGKDTEEEQYRALEQCCKRCQSPIARAVRSMGAELTAWYEQGCPANVLADKQADLLQLLRDTRSAELARALRSAKSGGAGIKEVAQKVLVGASTSDKFMARTIKRLFAQKPFLQCALDALSDWDAWVDASIPNPSRGQTLRSYIEQLWTLPMPERLLARRVLVRVHQPEGVRYAQDFDVEGVTEHRLYLGDFSAAQNRALVESLERKCRRGGIESAEALHDGIASTEAKGIIRASLKLESKNGTTIRPSFLYVEEALRDEFVFTSFEEAGLGKPIGYQSSFGTNDVASYQNLKVVCDRDTGETLALIKAKYLRKQEFPRRAKEEAYVGLTVKHSFSKGAFRETYPGIPLVMFVDMDKSLNPPAYAVTRLVTTGWDVYFSIDELKAFLKSQKMASVK